MEQKSWISKHKIATGFIILFALFFLLIVWAIVDISINNSWNQTSTQTEEKTMLDIKQIAIQVSYDDLIRYNEDYIGKVVYYQGNILQFDDSFLLVYVTKKGSFWENQVWFNYGGNERFLEYDTINIWGKVKGLKEYKALSGETFNIPEINVLQIELVQKSSDYGQPI